MKITCAGGSSSVFKSALKAATESMCTSSMMYTRYLALAGVKFDSSIRARMLSTPLLLAASISTTSRIDPSSRPRQTGQTPHGVAVLRVQAVDGLGENLRAGRLAGSARTRKQVRVRDPPRHQLVFQRDGHLRLADHIRKKLRPVFSVQRLIQAASSLLCLYKPKARRPFVEYVNGQATCIAPDDPLNAARSPA